MRTIIATIVIFVALLRREERPAPPEPPIRPDPAPNYHDYEFDGYNEIGAMG